MNFKIEGYRITSEEIEYLAKLGLKWCNRCREIKTLEEFGKDNSNKYGLDYRCKECRKNYATERRSDCPERVKELRRNSRNKHAEKSRQTKREWALNNKEHIREYKRNKYNTDTEYRITHACRELVKRMFRSTGVKKCYKTQEILGYTPGELKEHMEKQFKSNMTWDNYGEWHIDHIVPISSAKTLQEGIELSRLENLQPLWARENILKGNNLEQ